MILYHLLGDSARKMTSLKQDYFLHLLAYSNNKKQLLAVLKNLNNDEKVKLSSISSDILQERLPITAYQFKALLPYKVFIRKLSTGRVSVALLCRNLTTISKISEIYLKHNESCKETGASAYRRMGKDKKTINPKNKGRDSRSSSCSSGEEEWKQIREEKAYDTSSDKESQSEGSTIDEEGCDLDY